MGLQVKGGGRTWGGGAGAGPGWAERGVSVFYRLESISPTTLVHFSC